MRPSLRKIGAWPMAVKVPVVVTILMVAISAALSNQILVRLSQTQQRHLEQLASAYLDGLSSSLVPNLLRDDIWEIFDLLDRSRERYAGLSAVYTIVATRDDTILAASDPRRFPSQEAVPPVLSARFAQAGDLVLAEEEGRAFARRPLSYQGRPIGTIYAEIDIQGLLAERREVLVTLIIANAALTLVFAGFGYLAVRWMVRPIDILAAHLDRGRGGRIEPVPSAEIGAKRSEFGRLFRRYNALVRALRDREVLAARLAEEERMGSLGRLASGMAHEINNPLGGIFNAIDTLERHGENPLVRRSSLQILKRGLVGIRDVVRATLITYKGSGDTRRLRASDLDDLRVLIQQEVGRRRLDLAWRNELPDEVGFSAGPIRQTVLNLLLNACAASPVGGRVRLDACLDDSELTIEIGDQGPGLPSDVASIMTSVETDSVPPRNGSGLGAWMVNRLVRQMGGTVETAVEPAGGTIVRIRISAERERGLRNVA
jgi:signal transduction histidine kinase